jgi:glycosyltransferase involved in cell wall biosynthesis
VNPQFTLITSTLNSGATLERCLESVAVQTHASFEHLIADGASSDDTLAIVQRYSQRYPLRLACSTPDTGIYQAWNRAVDQARGTWILFLGSDDYLLAPDGLEQVASALSSDPSLHQKSFLYTDTDTPFAPTNWHTFKEKRWLNWLRGSTPLPTSIFTNRRLFDEGHRFDESYRICADHKFYTQHQFHANAAYIPMVLMSFQPGGISWRKGFETLQYRERRRMLHELGRSRPPITELYYWLRARV